MSEIRSFRGIFYNPKKVNLASVVAPPYDMISPQEHHHMYISSEYNIVHMIPDEEGNHLDEVSDELNSWMKESIFLQDEQPALYVLTQTFMMPDGKQVTRKGFCAAYRLKENGKPPVAPEEKIESQSKQYRLKLLEESDMMFNHVFSLYSDPSFEYNDLLYSITATKPFLEVEFDNVLNRLWKLTDGKTLTAILELFSNNKIFIADGHERYDVALAYRDKRRESNPDHTGNESYNFVPMYVTNMNDPGLIVLPIHRLIHNLQQFDSGELIEQLDKYFRITIYSSQNPLLRNIPTRKNTFGLVLPTSLGFILLELRTPSTLTELGVPAAIAKLDVSILHSLILEKILGITEQMQLQHQNIGYEPSIQIAIDTVKEGKAQAAFLLNPIPVEQIRELTDTGCSLLPKSTAFYPRLPSGLASYSFADE